NHDFDWQNVNIFHYESHLRKREIAEMFYIKCHSNSINLQRDADDLHVVYDTLLNNT
ncbi:hypothetical protein X777_03225, partial [Ooceraea biroi]